MNEKTCDQFAEKLVDYADGELPADESAAVIQHVATCPRCRETLAALRKSLALAQTIWQADEATLRDSSPVANVFQSPTRKRGVTIARRVAAIAAGVFLLLGGTLVWHTMHRPSQPIASGPSQSAPAQKAYPSEPATNQPTLAEARRTIRRAGVAMQMLGAAEFLAEQPGGEEIAQKRFHYILTTYPETTAAAEARSRLQSLSTRRT